MYIALGLAILFGLPIAIVAIGAVIIRNAFPVYNRKGVRQ